MQEDQIFRATAALLGAALVIGAAPASSPPPPQPAFNPDPWLADLGQMKAALTMQYANLDWLLTEREFDLDGLFVRAEVALRQTRSDGDARFIFERVISRIDDGHVSIEWPRRSASPTAAPPTDAGPTTPAAFCRSQGYQIGGRPGVVEGLPGYTPLATGDLLPSGTVDLAGQRIGLLRIGQFDPHVSPSLCEEAVRQLAVAIDRPCDEDCKNKIITFAYQRLTATLGQRLRDLGSRGAKLLIVDITGNGGGSEWTEAAARMMTPRRLTSARVGFVRGKHWERLWQEQAQRLRQFAAKARGNDKARLLGWAAEAESAGREAQRRCSPTGDTACPWLGQGGFASGMVGSVKPGEFADEEWGVHIFNPGQHPYTEGAWAGPLAILVDDETHSAAEQFAALLQDNGAGLIAGSRTGGSGCGYSWGGTPVTLPYSGGVLRLPDCARYRADGSNEVRGILPDVDIPWRSNDGRKLRASMLQRALADIVTSAGVMVRRPSA